ncbi:MAG: hypothetical protein INR71_12195 [Terriglobus roseus]|nr:hypothetical protein [Terriglobus roseus]
MPFLVVRIVCACIASFQSSLYSSTWSPLYGSIALLVLPRLLMEYIVVLIYAVLGYMIPSTREREVSKGEVVVRTGPPAWDEEAMARR